MTTRPKDTRIARKKHYLIAAGLGLAALLFAPGWCFSKTAVMRGDSLQRLAENEDLFKQQAVALAEEEHKLQQIAALADQTGAWLNERLLWIDMLDALQNSLKRTEIMAGQQLSTEVGVWIEGFYPDNPDALIAVAQSSAQPAAPAVVQNPFSMAEERRKRFGIPAPNASLAAAKRSISTNVIANIKLNCRGINLKRIRPTGNNDLAYALEKELKGNPFFDKNETKLTGQLEQVDETATTFTFDVMLRLKNPIKLN